MKKRFFKMACIGVALICVLAALGGCGAKTEKRYSASYYGTFDTVVTLSGFCTSQAEFDEISARVQEMLWEYHRAFDGYHAYEGLNNLFVVNRDAAEQPVRADAALFDMLLRYDALYEAYGAETNIALGAVTVLWHEARTAAQQTPDAALLADAAMHTDWACVKLDAENGTVFFSDAGLRLDVGAVAKGYAADRICEFLDGTQMKAYVLSLGGNVCVGNAPKDGRKYWKISIQHPDSQAQALDFLYVTDTSVVTSGDYQRYFMVGEEKYHHIINPRTNYPARGTRSVTVVCENSMLADYLSTALFVMDAADAIEFAQSIEGVEAMILREDASVLKTDGFSAMAESGGANAYGN